MQHSQEMHLRDLDSLYPLLGTQIREALKSKKPQEEIQSIREALLEKADLIGREGDDAMFAVIALSNVESAHG